MYTVPVNESYRFFKQYDIMISQKQVLTDIAKALVEFPEEVTVTETETNDTVYLVLSVAQSDMGKVIGKQGKIAKAIRAVMKSSGNAAQKRVTVEIQ